MRLSTRVLIPIFLAAGIGSALAADTKTDVTAAYKAWDAAFNSGDAKAVAASYAADAELLPPTHTISKGPAEIEKFFDGLIKGGVKGHALKLVEAGGNDKTVYGTANWSATDKDGKPIGGLATHVFERQNDGALKLKAHIFN
jgi:ketosteroid isomerase-like protein